MAAPALAAGNLSVWQDDGTSQQYNAVTIRIVSKTLRVTSADGKGTLIIQKAACSYVGQIQTCLPYELSLEQGGTTKPVNIKHGTIYVNLTSDTVQLPNSTAPIGPRGIVMSMTTKIGTIINMTGTIDEVVK